MRTVYKYNLKEGVDKSYALPKGAIPLHIGYDPRQSFSLWAEVDTQEAEQESIFICFVPTGGQVPERVTYLLTLHVDSFIFHVYWRRGE